jgi:hypothetical protein
MKKSMLLAGFALCALWTGVARAQTAVTALPGFHVGTFGQVPAGLTKPDSIITLRGHVWVGYGDTALPDGSKGNSNVVDYNGDGTVAHIITLKGHNDGLRYDPYTHKIWAVQNEDAIPNVVYIDPKSGAASKPVDLSTVNGGGYDDEAFIGGRIYISASNPALTKAGVNVHPAIVALTPLAGNYVPETVLMGNSPAVNTVTGEASRLNLTDPDSLTVTPDGNLLMTDQGDAQLILLRLHGGKGPYISQIPLIGGVQVDDTVFATSASGTLFISDTPANTIYKVTSRRFRLGKPYTASTGVPASGSTPAVPAFVGELFLDSGATVPIVSGLMAPHGMAFLAR